MSRKPRRKSREAVSERVCPRDFSPKLGGDTEGVELLGPINPTLHLPQSWGGKETTRQPIIERTLGKIQSTIQRYEMIAPGESVLVAVSGGPDSTALLLALYALSHKFGWALRAAHVNHGLRGECSDEDERFVRNRVISLDIPFHRKRIAVAQFAAEEKENLEAVARRERYDYLIRLARRYRCACIATGHTLDDQAETVLHHIVRSSGIEGLAGIAPIWTIENRRVVRPLADVRRNEVLEFLQAQECAFRIDESNADLNLTRNFIRHEILPRLERINPRVREALARLADIARLETEAHDLGDAQWLERFAQRTGHEIAVSRVGFLSLHAADQRRVVRRLLGQIAPDLHPTLDIIDRIRELASSTEGGRRCVFRGHGVVSRQKDRLVFTPCDSVTRSKRTGSCKPLG